MCYREVKNESCLCHVHVYIYLLSFTHSLSIYYLFFVSYPFILSRISELVYIYRLFFTLDLICDVLSHTEEDACLTP